MSEICGSRYYDDPSTACLLPKNHSDPDHHQSADGFHWLHHEKLIASAGTGDLVDDLCEMWDEPIDRLNAAAHRAALDSQTRISYVPEHLENQLTDGEGNPVPVWATGPAAVWNAEPSE